MRTIAGILALTAVIACKKNPEPIKETPKEPLKTEQTTEKEVIEVASFKGQQVTGVTVSNKGKVFANFPRWRKGVKHSVVTITENKEYKAYPNDSWNSWEIGEEINDSVFVAVQSVVAFNDKLFVLDTRNPLFKGVQDAPRLVVFDLLTDKLDTIIKLQSDSYHKDSYINDLRVDGKNNKIYLTDSGHAGLVVIDMVSGKSKRVLDNHKSTLAEVDHLTINGKKWNNTVHSDGIALDGRNQKLYYHALTGYNLYAVPLSVLNEGDKATIEAAVTFVQKTAAPDGMIFDDQGNLYYADLEQHKIMKRDVKGTLTTILEGEKVKWADTFSIYDGVLYYTNSRIHEAKEDVSALVFTINKIEL